MKRLFHHHDPAMKKIGVSIIAMLILNGGSVVAHPILDTTPTGYITDQADVLTQDQENQLEQQLTALTQETTAEIAVVILQSLEGAEITMLGTELATARGIGTAAQDNGILILIAIDERKRRIDIGYGLEGVIPDATAAGLGREVLVPALKQNKYYTGIKNIISRLTQKETRETVQENTTNDIKTISYIAIILAVIVALFIYHKPDKTKRKRTMIGGTMMSFGTIPEYGISGAIKRRPLLLMIRRIILFAKPDNRGSGSHYNTGSFGSGGFGGFGGFGGGSFGGGGASGGW